VTNFRIICFYFVCYTLCFYNSPVTLTITARRLRLFGHVARVDPSQYHSHAHRAAINRPPAEWRRRTGRPRRTWLYTVELDVRRCNTDLHSAWQNVRKTDINGRKSWRQLHSLKGMPPGDDDGDDGDDVDNDI